ncbi:hypothetical protein SFC57_04910 [Niallia circulans]|uniref:hypothetical protein n=1 Tax=Niallia circulans TaxID=1397 RepID=UPI003978653D
MRKKIILVGTFHFAENADMIKRKDEEIEELVSSIISRMETFQNRLRMGQKRRAASY